VGAASQEQRQDAVRVSNRVFKTLQGMYGSLFLSKFSTGKVLPNGGDAGVISARDVWAVSLQRFDAGTVGTALDRVLTDFPEFPPSLPQFVALCHACRPREAYKPAENVIGMSQELRSEYAAKAREINQKHAQRAVDKRLGAQADMGSHVGLDGLKSAIANAVACAGGDEVATLLRLDAMLAPKVAA
jgi:hypothetical protein